MKTLSLLSSRYSYEECKATADWLLAQGPVRPLLGVVCGSGLGGLAEMLKDQLVIKYSDIPNFPQSTGEFRPCAVTADGAVIVSRLTPNPVFCSSRSRWKAGVRHT